MGEIDAELSRLAREHAPRVLALLAGRFGDVDLADDAVQEALIEATTKWTEDSIPANPGAWLNTVARRKAIDHASPERLGASPHDERSSRADRRPK